MSTGISGTTLEFEGERVIALPSGALWWHGRSLLAVSDLHFGKAVRLARRGGPLLPPYEVEETLARLDADIARTEAKIVVCLGDSFDDMQAASELNAAHREWLARLQAGRRWVWITGNHDPAPIEFAGTHVETFYEPPLVFRHIATIGPKTRGEVSGHFHPKARVSVQGRGLSRPCFLHDEKRLILPAYGTYTGGLRTDNSPLDRIMSPDARAILTGTPMVTVPMPRG